MAGTKVKTMSLNQALKYAGEYGYDEITNSIDEKFTFEGFYKYEGNSRGWVVIPNIAGKAAKMIKYLDFGRRYRVFTLR